MKALGPEITSRSLGHDHIESLAPHFIGEAAWEVISPAGPDCWGEFKILVEQRYGLS